MEGSGWVERKDGMEKSKMTTTDEQSKHMQENGSMALLYLRLFSFCSETDMNGR